MLPQGSAGRKPEIKVVSLRTERSYKANGPGKVAQRTYAQGSGLVVNDQIAQRKFTFLSGEIPAAQACREVSRGHSTPQASEGRPEPDRCCSTTRPRYVDSVSYRQSAPEDPDGKHGAAQVNLLERILSRDNMHLAWQRVKANKGSAGIDGMSIADFPEFARHHWHRIRSALYEGTYRPAAIRRVMIPKPSGGQRPLGIPTVLDRVIQQAITQALVGVFDPTFSEHSYGFRPSRSAHMALDQLQSTHKEGFGYCVDCDLESFFDTVNHGLLLSRLARHIRDKRVLGLISRYLRSSVSMPDGCLQRVTCGVPQGGPLSPLLANVMLDDLDKELERRGHRFVRYADDFLIFVRSRQAADRVLESIGRFITDRLKLKVNKTKSKACKLQQCGFLGYRLFRGKLRWQDQAVARFKDRLRQITSRSNGQNIESRIRKLNSYISGWMNYYGYSHSYTELVKLDKWVRRRVRLCYWKQWKRPRTRRKRLLNLGADPEEVKLATRSRKGLWRMASNRIVQQALSNQWLWDQGVVNMRQRWIELHYPAT